MKKNDYLQIRIDKSSKLLIFAYCKKHKKKFTDLFDEMLYLYLSVNDLNDFYKYREELNNYQKSLSDDNKDTDDILRDKANYFINRL